MFWNRKKESRCKADDDVAKAVAVLGCGLVILIGVVVFLVATVVRVWLR